MNNIKIGKYTLESITYGMYKDPFILYREYIQNSCDAIEEAIWKNVINRDDSYIKVFLDKENKNIEIEDNGIGIPQKHAYEILTDIGNSNKFYFKNKGFRGIGRLSGLPYCQKLIFETSFINESLKSTLIFNCTKLNDMLIPGSNHEISASKVIESVTTLYHEPEDKNNHYFKVTLTNVYDNFEDLLDFKLVYNFLVQVAPIPFDENKFPLCVKINDYIKYIGLDKKHKEYKIFLGSNSVSYNELFKPYKNNFYANKVNKSFDEIYDIEIKELWDEYNQELLALVWYGKSNLYGSILDEEIKGLRLREGNILIGDNKTLNYIFKEERFNGWFIGEVLVNNSSIIPNARRDDFEKNQKYLHLLAKLKDLAKILSEEIRKMSKERNKNKANGLKNKNEKKHDLLEKIDLLVNKATFEEEINKIKTILYDELDKDKADIIIERINKLI